MKKSGLIILSIIFLTSNISCQLKTQRRKLMYQLFNINSQYQPGIDHPVSAWQFDWNVGRDVNRLGSRSNPSIDGVGNIYINGHNDKFYSISPDGKPRWQKENAGEILATNDGFILKSAGLGFYDVNGQNKWLKQDHASDFYMGPDGFLYVTVLTEKIYSVDQNGNKRWEYVFPKQDKETVMVRTIFFDSEKHVFFIIENYDSSANLLKRNVLVSFTSEGQFRWQKEFTHDNLNYDFIPKGFVFNDTFLLRFYGISEHVRNSPERLDEERAKPKQIIAYSTSGSELWQLTETGYINGYTPYSMDQNSTFYYTVPRFSPGRSILKALSKEGKILWEKEISGGDATQPLIDNQNHIYLGTCLKDRWLYAFFPDGRLKWSMKQFNPDEGVYEALPYEFGLAFGPNRSIYYFVEADNMMYCVSEKK